MSNPLARKPSNLFLTEERVVEIMDFGLAKMVEEVRRASTIIGGTPNYMAPEMAPEQAVGDPTDHRGDLYALGGTLFHLITGTVPYPDRRRDLPARPQPDPLLRRGNWGDRPGLPSRPLPRTLEGFCSLTAKKPA